MTDENDQPRHITAQVSNAAGEVTNDMVIDTETGEVVATDPMSENVSEFMDMVNGIMANNETEED